MKESSSPSANAPPGQPRPFDWVLLALLVVVGGTSFSLIRASVETIPPALVGAGRLWVAAAVMYAVMRLAGRRFPVLLQRTSRGLRLTREWAYMLAVSAIGYVAPFFIFPWAQQYIESGLAGVYMAFMPIWTLGLANIFANESLNANKLAGFALGFLGVMVLMGPDVIGGAARSGLLAQAGLLLATLCYAGSVVISRRAPAIRPRVFAAGTILGAALLSTPLAFTADWSPAAWSGASILSIFALGAAQTGLAGLIIIMVVKRVGAGFMSLANYVTPAMAVLVGAIVFGERLGANVFIALAIILAGVAVSQRRARPVAATSGGLAPISVATAKAEAPRESEAV